MTNAVLVFLAIVGTYYVGLGGFVLLNLNDVTAAWIEHSNDPDFRYDFRNFKLLTGVGAMAVSMLGVATVACAMRTVTGRVVPAKAWIVLAVAAPLIHFPWLLYRVIGTGTLPRAEAALSIRAVAIRFGVVCAAYLLASVLTRRAARPLGQMRRVE